MNEFFFFFGVISVFSFCECLKLFCANFVSRFSALCLEEFVHEVCGSVVRLVFSCSPSSVIDLIHVFTFVLG